MLQVRRARVFFVEQTQILIDPKEIIGNLWDHYWNRPQYLKYAQSLYYCSFRFAMVKQRCKTAFNTRTDWYLGHRTTKLWLWECLKCCFNPFSPSPEAALKTLLLHSRNGTRMRGAPEEQSSSTKVHSFKFQLQSHVRGVKMALSNNVCMFELLSLTFDPGAEIYKKNEVSVQGSKTNHLMIKKWSTSALVRYQFLTSAYENTWEVYSAAYS